MSLRKLRLYAAGVVAFLIGMPLTEQAVAGTGDVIWAGINLAAAVADSVGRS